jgi:membrane dipeptidase
MTASVLPAFLRDAPVIDGSISGVSAMPYVEDILQGGFHAGNWTVAGGFGDAAMSTLAKIAERYSLIEQHADRLLLVERGGDIERARREGKFGVILGFQGIESIEGRFHLLAVYHKLGVRAIGLTYNNRNVVGAGCLEPDDSRLTRFGIEVVREMNRLGILLDLTHVGNRTSLDAMAVSSAPVVFSHSNAKALRDNPRNITDEQIRACAGTGGVVGIATFADFVADTTGGKRPSLDDYFRHIDHIAQLVGVNHVGIGSDIFADPTHGTWWNSNTRMRYPEICGGMTYETHGLRGFERHSEFPQVVQALQRRGYREADIAKIVGGNFYRVFRTVWGE